MKKYLLNFTLLLVTATQLFAVETAAIDLKKILNNIETLEGHFSQVIQNDAGQTTGQFNGLVKLKKPRLFLWDVRKPEKSKVVSDGKQIWNYDVELEQVTVQPIKGELEQTPVFFLTGELADLEKQYTIKELASNKSTCLNFSQHCFELIPKNPEAPFQKIQLGFHSNIIKELIVQDQMGQLSSFVFSRIALNTGLNDKVFKFKPPKGVDVIGTPLS